MLTRPQKAGRRELKPEPPEKPNKRKPPDILYLKIKPEQLSAHSPELSILFFGNHNGIRRLKLFFVAGARHCTMSAIVAAHRLSAPPVFYYTDYYSRNYRYKHRTYNYCSYMCRNPRKHTTDSSLLILAAGIILRRRAVKF